MSSGLAGLHMKGAFERKPFTISGNLLALGEVVPSGSASPQLSKIRIKKTCWEPRGFLKQ